ncbi:hypothetical protein GRAN_4684 [Granulicella sibirica]|uniref:Uncharacterized protein n=2 Tax=Granulicella sibirica TaxID=2479048 RepID=A0A4Q0SXP0_9BACT|nr:hypothetical protein GRAN_4684 [Granulicella sibirica]
MCEAGEAQGVAIARYHQIGDIDWVASPIMQFLYATDRPEDIPAYATADSVWEMRQRYRRRYMLAIVPDGTEKEKATNEWWETVGVAYNRKVWGYQIATSREQDEQFVATMNSRPNKHLYHLKKTNCADFAAEMVNLYFPGAVHNDRIGDFGLMTPKEVARCVQAYAKEHPFSDYRVLEIPQVPGSLRRSRPVRGGAEAGLKTKRYLFTLAVIQPEVPIGLTVLYLWHGRWKIGEGAELAGPENFMSPVEQAVGTK